MLWKTQTNLPNRSQTDQGFIQDKKKKEEEEEEEDKWHFVKKSLMKLI